MRDYGQGVNLDCKRLSSRNFLGAPKYVQRFDVRPRRRSRTQSEPRRNEGESLPCTGAEALESAATPLADMPTSAARAPPASAA